MFLYMSPLLILGIVYVSAYQSYVERIPNGDNVNYTACSNTIQWLAVGHVSPGYTGNPFHRNIFGEDFATANRTWTTELCNDDSDMDGLTNGEELGFTDCGQASAWNNDPSSVSLSTPLGHPGICEQNANTPANVNCTAVNINIPATQCN